MTERTSVDRCAEATHLGATVLRLPADTECRADLGALVAKLYASGVRSVLRLLLRGEPLTEDIGVGDCVAEAGGGLMPAGFVEGVRDFDNPERCYLFRWGLGDVVTVVAGAGLRITVLQEYTYSNGERHFAGMRKLSGKLMVPPGSVSAVPLMYGIRACKTERQG